MHPLATTIRQVSANLKALRDFVDVLGNFLAERRTESIWTHAHALGPVLLALDEYAAEANGMDIPILTAEQKERLRTSSPDVSATAVKKEGDGEAFSLTFEVKPSPETAEFRKALDELARVGRRTQMLYASSLMNLASSVELFFSNLLHAYYGLHPEAIGTKEKLFSFDDLSKFETVAEARSYHVASKIEDLLRGPLSDWIAFARGTIKLSMGYLESYQPALEESFQRRNVVVHNAGVANSIYISKVAESERNGIVIGDNITPGESYLNSRIDMWEKTCILIAAELWKKLAPGDSDRASVLMEIGYEHLVAERWNVAEAVNTFLLLDKQVPEATGLSAQLNVWQCQKRSGAWDRARVEVERADYTAKGLVYQLARLALLERTEEFFMLLPRALKSGDIGYGELSDWPIFREMRASDGYEPYRMYHNENATAGQHALPGENNVAAAAVVDAEVHQPE